MPLDQERKFFESHKSEWLKLYKNQFVLVSDSDLLGVFPDAETAYAEGLTRLGPQSFLVRQVLEDEPIAVLPILSAAPHHAGL